MSETPFPSGSTSAHSAPRASSEVMDDRVVERRQIPYTHNAVSPVLPEVPHRGFVDDAERKATAFDATVSALCYSLIQERCEQSGQAGAAQNRVVRFVLGRCAHMQDFLRLPMKCLVLLFDLLPIFRGGRRFHRMEHAARWKCIQRWRTSRIGAMREFVRFFESLALFGWYSAHDCS